jgi:polyhydroxyalkanoate synthesis regulator phasin
VADALLNVIRAAARLTDFAVEDAEELVKYAVRRGLLGSEEGDRLLLDVHAADQKRHDKIALRAKEAKAKARGKPKPKAHKKPGKKKR